MKKAVLQVAFFAAMLCFSIIIPMVSAPKLGVGVYYPIHETHDAWETGAGSFYFNISYNDVRCWLYRTSSYYRGAGILFAGVTIPQGANVISATLKVYVYSAFDDPLCKIYGNDVDNSLPFTGSNGKVFGRSKTTAYETWDATDIGTGWRVVSVTSAVQEVVDRGGWTSGNNMSLLLIPELELHRTILFYSYEAHIIYPLPDYSPQLTVQWG